MIRRFDALKRASACLAAHQRDENIGEILLEARLALSRTELLANLSEPLSASDAAWLEACVREHVKYGRPVQYMLGEAPFYGRTFHVTPTVLIPRPETEELVRQFGKWLDHVFDAGTPLRVCDIGTGSGAIAVTLALEHPNCQVTATDISEQALTVARGNAAKLGAQVTFRCGNFLDPLKGEFFNGLISNPPYITRAEMISLEDTVKNFEPHLALCGGEDGLDPYRKIICDLTDIWDRSSAFLLAFEIGYQQGRAVRTLISDHFSDAVQELEIVKDLAGFDRMALAVLRPD